MSDIKKTDKPAPQAGVTESLGSINEPPGSDVLAGIPLPNQSPSPEPVESDPDDEASDDPDEMEDEIEQAEEEGDFKSPHRGTSTKTASHKRSKVHR